MKRRQPVIAFGEIVWDLFDDTAVLGGAPLNVAYHLQAQNWPVALISRVGDDRPGKEAIEKTARLGVTVAGIQEDAARPTGVVRVSLDERNEPSFDIARPAAWDNIRTEDIPGKLTPAHFHLVFGTLAQRDDVSRRTLQHLIEKADKKFYDVNLRPPHTPAAHVRTSLRAADVVKVNRAELRQLNRWFVRTTNDDLAIGRQLIEMFDISVLAVTAGGNGATLISGADSVCHPGFPVAEADPVGSGDAFFSALIIGYLNRRPLYDCLLEANRLGSWVASQAGATPRRPDRG